MPASSPPIDKRSEADLVAETERLAEAYSGWKRRADGSPDLGSALIRIFARMAAQAVDRLNRVPDRSFLAFLNLIGVDPAPPRPARVPLTFTLAEGGDACPLVPAGTRVGATALPGDPDEVIFETALDLVTSRSKITSVRIHEPGFDRWADRSAEAKGTIDRFYAAFTTDTAIEHSLFIAADEVLALAKGTTITLTMKLAAADLTKWQDLSTKPAGSPTLEWTYFDGNSWVPLPNLTISAPPSSTTFQLTFSAPGPIAAGSVNGVSGRFLRARLQSYPDSGVPAIADVTLSAPIKIAGRAPDAAYQNGMPLDMSADFFPLGERPRFNDTFFIASKDVLGKPGGKVTVTVTPSEARVALTASDTPVLVWEISAGGAWKEIGRSTKTSATGAGFSDETLALSKVPSQAAPGPYKVTFTAPADAGQGSVQGVQSAWLRARLLMGNYGSGVVIVPPAAGSSSVTVRDDGYRPPILKTVTLDLDYTLTIKPGALLTRNHFVFADRRSESATGFVPFTRSSETRPALYIGFDQAFENRPMTLYAQIGALSPNALQGGAVATPAEIVWEYSSPSGWKPLGAVDETRGFSQSGLLHFIGPLDFVAASAFGESRPWLRARWARGDFQAAPRVGHISMNTVWATHTTTIRGESLAPIRDGAPRSFKMTRSPVLSGEIIEVREMSEPAGDERAALEALGESSAITITRGDDGHIEEVWVRWTAVPDFHASGPRDRHYRIDRATGEVQFGDGQMGMSPPLGPGSIRAAFYQIGGGAYGARSKGSITSLKAAVPYVDGVTNQEPATGGADGERPERLIERGPRLLRHNHRAVSAEDFEDLALEASPSVCRVRAITPHFDPIQQAESPGNVSDAGKVGLIIVPVGTERRPTPTLGLIQDVESYIEARCAASAALSVTGPDWIEVTAAIKIVPASAEGSDAMRNAIIAALDRFLHPLTGGPEGKGWEFGRLPHLSDLYPLLASIPGVGYVRGLTLTYTRPGELPTEGASGAVGPVFDETMAGDALDRVLIFAGPHTVDILSPEV